MHNWTSVFRVSNIAFGPGSFRTILVPRVSSKPEWLKKSEDDKKEGKAITVSDENRDSPISNLLQDILDKTERRKWFLYKIMQGSKNTESLKDLQELVQASIQSPSESDLHYYVHEY